MTILATANPTSTDLKANTSTGELPSRSPSESPAGIPTPEPTPSPIPPLSSSSNFQFAKEFMQEKLGQMGSALQAIGSSLGLGPSADPTTQSLYRAFEIPPLSETAGYGLERSEEVARMQATIESIKNAGSTSGLVGFGDTTPQAAPASGELKK